jgi:hypothetical protein
MQYKKNSSENVSKENEGDQIGRIFAFLGTAFMGNFEFKNLKIGTF